MKDKLLLLKNALGPLGPYPQHSRTHPLRGIGNDLTSCFVKRDDELGFGISGSKIRKYLSLLPWLQTTHVEEALIMGGAFSNNILGLSQLLIESGITPTLFLRGEKGCEWVGNHLYTNLLVPEERIHWIPREAWANVESYIAAYRSHAPQRRIAVIPEGACMPQALPGALTLPLDIVENNGTYDHVVMDAGTGLMACATLLSLVWLEQTSHLHVVLLAENEEAFLRRAAHFKPHFEALVGQDLSWERITAHLTCHKPIEARSFGAINQAIFQEVLHLARQEGFLADPLYSAKLFATGRHLVKEKIITGRVLFIHSGGGLSLAGFQTELARTVQKFRY